MDAEDRALDAGGLRNDAARGPASPGGGPRPPPPRGVRARGVPGGATFVATSNPADRGVYNNWLPADEVKPVVERLMAGASRGKTMYVIPYLMAPPGTPLDAWAR